MGLQQMRRVCKFAYNLPRDWKIPPPSWHPRVFNPSDRLCYHETGTALQFGYNKIKLCDDIISAPIMQLKHIFPYYRIYVSVNWVSIGSGNGLALYGRQAIT